MKRVLVVGGAPEYVGAVYLAAISALRSGAESVIVMAPEKVAWALNALSPDLMTRKLPGNYLSKKHESVIRAMLTTADILVIGNGAGLRPGTQDLMRSLAKWRGAKVIDADALKVLRVPVSNAILTPNKGEWDTLTEKKLLKALVAKNVVVRKGAPTTLLSARRTYHEKRTNPGLEKAGMGDVLAGLIAGCLARGLQPWDAAKKALEIGGSVADILTKRKRGYYFLASDISEELKKPTKRKRR